MARLAAFIVMLIPGLMAAGGIKFMRDTLFGKLISPSHFMATIRRWHYTFCYRLWLFAGFLLHRDRKMEKWLRASKNKNSYPFKFKRLIG